jgi:hypothetical protein
VEVIVLSQNLLNDLNETIEKWNRIAELSAEISKWELPNIGLAANHYTANIQLNDGARFFARSCLMLSVTW